MQRIINLTLIILTFIFYNISTSQIINQEEIKSKLMNLPFNMEVINLPTIPSNVFSIKDFGAIGDGLTNNTSAIANAIKKCKEAKGGRVVIPAGLWISGPIEFCNNMELHLEKGAMLVFSSNRGDYPLIEAKSALRPAYPIYASNLKNIAITGQGLIDGNGDSWRPVKKNKLTESQWKKLVGSGGVISEKADMWWPSESARNSAEYLSKKSKEELTKEDYEYLKDFNRPDLLYFINCSNVLLDEVTFQNSPKFTVNLEKCENIIIRKVRVMNEWWSQNGDGIDLTSCKNALIYDCTVNAGDDGICMKSSASKKERSLLENIVIMDCVVYHAHGGFVIGSNTHGNMKNIYVKNCNFTWTDTGLRFKSGIGRGGLVEDVYIDGIYMKDIEKEAIIFELDYTDASQVKTKDSREDINKYPKFSKITISNLVCDGAEYACRIGSVNPDMVTGVKLTDVVIKSKYGVVLNNSGAVSFNNVTIKNKEQYAYNISNCENIVFAKLLNVEKYEKLISIDGTKTKNIIIEDSELKSNLDKIYFKDTIAKENILIVK